MAANDLTPYYADDARTVTAYVEAAVTGKRAVIISGPRVDDLPQISPAGAGAVTFGVAARDAATGARVTVHRGGIIPVTAGASITAGQAVKSTSVGKATPAANGDVAIGVAIDDAAEDEDTPVAFYPHVVGGAEATNVVGDQTAVSDLGALTSAAITGGESPTEAEHNAVQADVAAIRTTVNTILARLRSAGLLAT